MRYIDAKNRVIESEKSRYKMNNLIFLDEIAPEELFNENIPPHERHNVIIRMADRMRKAIEEDVALWYEQATEGDDSIKYAQLKDAFKELLK